LDFISEFVEHTNGLPTPEIFRLWTAISALGGVLERKVYTRTARTPLFPNLFVVLVGGPATGKSVAISEAVKLWQQVEKVNLAPDDVTGASLIDSLSTAPRSTLLPDNSTQEFHSMLIPAPELGVLLPEYDQIMIGLLCYLYDNPHSFTQKRRTGNRNINITLPHISILAGCTPGYLASTFPEQAWTTGFSSRTIMIYSASHVKVPLFSGPKTDALRADRLAGFLNNAVDLHGEFTWADDAAMTLERWAMMDCSPVPEHSKLQTYVGRRALNMIKLCMIAAVSRTCELNIELQDVQRAQEWLLQAEALMPDIFRDMVHRSDSDVLNELHFYLWKRWVKDRVAVHESALYHFLGTKVPSEKIGRIIDIAERSNMITREAGSQMWTPRPKSEHGEE